MSKKFSEDQLLKKYQVWNEKLMNMLSNLKENNLMQS